MDQLSNQFIDVKYDRENQCLVTAWKPATENATWDDIKTGFTDYFLKLIQDLGPKYLIIDEREMRRPYNPEEQQWVDKNSATIVINSPVEKIAIVISHDGFVELSTETMMDEEVSQGLNTQFFESIDDAEKWLYK